MKNLNKKQKIILTLLGVGIVGLIVLGITYAYFIAVVEPGEKAPVDITTDTTDNLLFDVEDNINLAINKYNFGVGGDNLTSHAKATATLRANSTDNTATYNYYLYFNIESNEFVYTTEDNKPEIILTITDPNGNPVTAVEGLTYVTAGSVSGFDITTASGLFTIASNYEITSNSSTTDTIQEWNFTATFINLDSDQNDNTGKRMNGTIAIRKNNLDNLFATYIRGLYTTQGANNLYLHDSTLANSAEDNSYRYSGVNPNNYVCLDNNITECSEDKLFRIIGVFNGKVKLIKATSIGSYAWNENGNNIWKNSTLEMYLNSDYLTDLGIAEKLIQDSYWYVGGISGEDGDWTTKSIFDYEVGINHKKDGDKYEDYEDGLIKQLSNTTYFGKIGMPYFSDLLYASESNNWENQDYYSNWLYGSEGDFWLISRMYKYSWASWTTGFYEDDVTVSYLVRPAFYLDTFVSYKNGDGSIENPFRIEAQ